MPNLINPATHQTLDSWLHAHDARNVWVKRISPQFDVEGWTIHGRVFLVTRYRDGGWDIFTANTSLDIARTLADAEIRLQIPEPRTENS